MHHYLLVSTLARDTIRRYASSLTLEPLREVSARGSTVFVGDTHGALDVTAYVISTRAGTGFICFLGDVVDRGTDQLLNLLLIAESALLDERIILVRGNHESASLNRYHGFTAELGQWGCYETIYPAILEMYGKLPYAVLLNGTVLGLHGGIPRGGLNLVEWKSFVMDTPDQIDPRAIQILWNDPGREMEGFSPSPRGEGAYLFGEDVFKKFLDSNSLRLLLRGHEVKMEGYEEMFGGRLISIFSSRYHGGKAAIAIISADPDEAPAFEILPGGREIREEWNLPQI